jgi:hypothetical protein
MLVKEGKTKEQSENSQREAKFLANKNKQAETLAAEKRAAPASAAWRHV